MAELTARVPKSKVHSDEEGDEAEEKENEKEKESLEGEGGQVDQTASVEDHEYEPLQVYESYEPYSTRTRSEVMLANMGQDMNNLKWWTKKASKGADDAENAIQDWSAKSAQTFKDSLKSTAEVVQGVEKQLKNAHEMVTKEVQGSVEAKLQGGGAGPTDQTQEGVSQSDTEQSVTERQTADPEGELNSMSAMSRI